MLEVILGYLGLGLVLALAGIEVQSALPRLVMLLKAD